MLPFNCLATDLTVTKQKLRSKLLSPRDVYNGLVIVYQYGIRSSTEKNKYLALCTTNLIWNVSSLVDNVAKLILALASLKRVC